MACFWEPHDPVILTESAHTVSVLCEGRLAAGCMSNTQKPVRLLSQGGSGLADPVHVELEPDAVGGDSGHFCGRRQRQCGQSMTILIINQCHTAVSLGTVGVPGPNAHGLSS